MEYINKLEKYLSDKYDSIVVINNDISRPDLELSEWYTADDYTLYVLTNDAQNVNWETDVYYYEPDFETIIERIEETVFDVGHGSEVRIYIEWENFLPEDEVLYWIEEDINKTQSKLDKGLA
tara:strand:+ start:188 stop:553 length:366 start_codon:yes stop_codon:yes gene_type:complete